MTIEEFVSTEHNGSGAARGCGYCSSFDFERRYEGLGYDLYTYYGEAHCGGSDAERKSCGFGEANGAGNPCDKSFGYLRIKLK